MPEGGYRILIDYGYEGWRFWDLDGKEDYATVDEAVKTAASLSGNPFLIVRVVDWQASEVPYPNSQPPAK